MAEKPLMRAGFAAGFPELAAGLRTAYAEPHRAYHNWSHIEALLGHFRRLQSQMAYPEAVELAIHYHDAVYRPLSFRNEWLSARRMCRELAGRMHAEVLDQARALVLATALHQVPRRLPAELRYDCGLFLDIDLSILGVEPARFDAYEQAICREYATVPERLYRSARKAVFRRLLRRRSVYHSPEFRASHEQAARANLERAIRAL